jgi:hypothetical protein
MAGFKKKLPLSAAKRMGGEGVVAPEKPKGLGSFGKEMGIESPMKEMGMKGMKGMGGGGGPPRSSSSSSSGMPKGMGIPAVKGVPPVKGVPQTKQVPQIKGLPKVGKFQ